MLAGKTEVESAFMLAAWMYSVLCYSASLFFPVGPYYFKSYL